MFDLYHITVILISFGAAFLSGLLGIGGGTIVFPAFFYLMPFLGLGHFTLSEITGITATQSLAGMFFAYLNHRTLGHININLVKTVMPAGIAGGIIGAISPKFMPEKALLLIYIFLLVFSIILILMPEIEHPDKDQECVPSNYTLTNLIIFSTTAISGSLGFAGAVSFVPILNHFCRAPFKTAISTTTLVVFLTTAIVFAGKAAVGFVPMELIVYIIIGAIFGANVGSRVNKLLKPVVLKTFMIVIIVILGTRITLTLFGY